MSEVVHVLVENRRLSAAIEQRTARAGRDQRVQQALAAELNMQGIYDAVGDKIREIFHDADLDIRILDPDTGLVEFPYLYDRGERISVDPSRSAASSPTSLGPAETLVIKENFDAEAYDSSARSAVPGTQRARSPACGFRWWGRRGARAAHPHQLPARARVQPSRRPPAGDVGRRDERRAGERPPVRRDPATLQGERAASRRARGDQQRPDPHSPPS